MRKRSTINGFDLPTPMHLASRGPRPEPERVELTNAFPVDARHVFGFPDVTCMECGHIVHAPSCPMLHRMRGVAAFTPFWLPAPEPAPEEALPEGWTDTNVGIYEHVSGARVEVGSNGRVWYGRSISRGHISGATRAEAMAAALGFTIHGAPAPGFFYARDDARNLQALRRTAEAAALAALEFDADQRRRDSMCGLNSVTRGTQGG